MLIRDACAAEKALVSLPNSLIACDELSFPGGAQHQMVQLTAGLHRQTWVCGIPMFVDVHISTTSRKTIKELSCNWRKIRPIAIMLQLPSLPKLPIISGIRIERRKKSCRRSPRRMLGTVRKASHLIPMRFGLEPSLCRQYS